MSTSIRKSCNKLWRYQGLLLLFARIDTTVISCPHLLDLYLLADNSRTCWQKHSDEENCQPDPQWHFRTVDTAGVDGRAAIYSSQLPRPAAGIRVIHHCPGTCCSQRWVGEYEMCFASSEQGLGGTGWERLEKDVEEKNWFFVVFWNTGGEVVKMFEEKLVTVDFCLIFECIEDRGNEVRIWETRGKGHSIQGQKTRILCGELTAGMSGRG